MAVSMKKLINVLPLLGDAGLALITLSLTSLFFDTPVTLALAIWVFFFSYAPDVDGLIHYATTGKLVADLENGRDHREGLHYPLLWLLVFAVVIYFFGLTIWTASALVATMMHFLHDTIGVGWGVKLFFPFDSGSYKLFSKKYINADISLTPVIVRYSPEELEKTLKEIAVSVWIEPYFCHPTRVAVVDYSLFIIGIISFSYTLL
jgi:hypothetical protein